ncbi:hypothetical protein WS86_11510 [Burkholderia savannae]|uniref:hypothetical protein n=1 Tax=Burkholderia savannae TaxID=1637837 RepID=UPI000754C429|nr:hypothetical protein [Burkholderia savannae]AOJ81174.1 hypothetical protein WS86_11510 [Burkholderia savannae]
MNDQQQSRADALTYDQRQALGEALAEYFGKLDSDEGIRTPEGRILRTFDYCDSRTIDDLIDRAIVPALAAPPLDHISQAGKMVDEQAAFEAHYAKMWNAAYNNTTNHTAADVAELREGDTYGEDRTYLNASWEGWQARAASAIETGAEEATTEAAMRKTMTSEQIRLERKLTCEAIDGAIAFGYQNTNAPPSDDHWLATYWRMGQKLAELDALPASARYPTAWIRFRSDGGFEGPIMDSDERMCDTRRKSGAWSPLFLGPAQASPPTCTCPSGDGSLRWPCPMHPPRRTSAELTNDDKRDAERYRAHIKYEYETLYMPGAEKKGLRPLAFAEYKASADQVADAARTQGSQS